jgi:tetratricopeptide (TPR) repeat protein
MFSSIHYRDYCNEQMLIGPLGLFLFVIAAAAALADRGARRLPATVFSLAAGAVVLATSWTFTDSNLGYARDWDLLAHTGMVFTVAGLALLAVARPAAAGRGSLSATLACCVLVSFYHTAPWIALNASEARSFARLQTLPLGGGRTEVLVSGWYRVRGDDDGQREWLMRAIRAYPGNINTYYLLGKLEMENGNYAAAAAAFEQAVAMRKRDPKFRSHLVYALRAQNLLAETIPHLEIMLKSSSTDVVALVFLAEAYEGTARGARAQAIYTRIVTMARDYVTGNQEDGTVLATYGWALHKLNRSAEAVPFLRAALSARRPAPVAHCYLSLVLEQLGSLEEARSQYRECQTAIPYYPDHAAIAARLLAVETDAAPTAP